MRDLFMGYIFLKKSVVAGKQKAQIFSWPILPACPLPRLSSGLAWKNCGKIGLRAHSHTVTDLCRICPSGTLHWGNAFALCHTERGLFCGGGSGHFIPSNQDKPAGNHPGTLLHPLLCSLYRDTQPLFGCRIHWKASILHFSRVPADLCALHPSAHEAR